MEEMPVDLQVGEPIKRGTLMKGRLAGVISGGWQGVRLRIRKVGWVLERHRGRSCLIAGGKAEEMGTDDGEWTGHVWALTYQHHLIYRTQQWLRA